jgi:nucleoside-diphosphate-sugar epimerase
MTAGPKALVTGAAGFIGAHCVRYLAERGWRVRALDVHEAPQGLRSLDVDFRVQDLRDSRALAAAVAGMEVVFHLASVHLAVGATYEEFESVNVKAAEELVRLCAEAGVRRLVHVSSVGVYGHVEHPPADEGAPLRPNNTYEKTKRAGEDAVRAAAARHGVDVVIVRPSWVYGTGCPRTEKLLGALRKGRFFYIGAARNLRHPIFIDDFLEGLVLAATGPREIAGRTFNLAGPRWMTVEEMVCTFAKAAEVREPKVRIPRSVGLTLGWAAEVVAPMLRIEPPISRRTLAFFENDNAFSIEAARSALGFEPRIDLLEGVRRSLGPGLLRTAPGSVGSSRPAGL